MIVEELKFKRTPNVPSHPHHSRVEVTLQWKNVKKVMAPLPQRNEDGVSLVFQGRHPSFESTPCCIWPVCAGQPVTAGGRAHLHCNQQ